MRCQQRAYWHSAAEGLLALRQAIAERVKQVNQIDVDPATEVVVTNGGQEALMLMVLAALAPGDAIIIPEPNYNTYHDALKFARVEKIGIPSTAATNFRTDPVRAALTDKTRALLLVSPNNPTASVIQRADLEALIALAHERDLIIIADDTSSSLLMTSMTYSFTTTTSTSARHRCPEARRARSR